MSNCLFGISNLNQSVGGSSHTDRNCLAYSLARLGRIECSSASLGDLTLEINGIRSFDGDVSMSLRCSVIDFTDSEDLGKEVL